MSNEALVYSFRRHGISFSETVVCASARSVVAAAFGGGGIGDINGLISAFGGGVTFEDEQTGDIFLGVWGKRNAGRFRTALRSEGFVLEIVREPPIWRLKYIFRGEARPDRRKAEAE